MEKTNELYIVSGLVECHFATVNFDPWMSKGTYDVFALVIHFINNDRQPKHVTIGLFEAIKITW
jgi:hypothetical protein